MSALIDSMASLYETPWHGLGVVLQEEVTVEEMIKAASLDWEVKLGDAYFYSQDDKGQQVLVKNPRHKIMYRADRNFVLDIVGTRYKPYQNKDVLQFFHNYVEAGDMVLETAGSLDNGRMIWGLAKMNESFKVGSEDTIENYLLLANPHQYGKAMIVKYTPIRVVCNNTLTYAINTHSDDNILLAHIREFNDAMKTEVATRIGLAQEKMKEFEEECNLMADIALTQNSVTEILLKTFVDKQSEKPKDRVINIITDLYNGHAKGSSLSVAKNNGWALFNAVTEYFDWHAGRTVDTRIKNAWFGPNSVLKHKIKNDILEYGKAA